MKNKANETTGSHRALKKKATLISFTQCSSSDILVNRNVFLPGLFDRCCPQSCKMSNTVKKSIQDYIFISTEKQSSVFVLQDFTTTLTAFSFAYFWPGKCWHAQKRACNKGFHRVTEGPVTLALAIKPASLSAHCFSFSSLEAKYYYSNRGEILASRRGAEQ